MISWDDNAVSAYLQAETFKKEYRQQQAESMKETEAVTETATEEEFNLAKASDG